LPGCVGAGCDHTRMRHLSDAQRRARLGRRHALAVASTTVEEAVESVTCLHATEPASVYLSLAARTQASRADVDRALYEDRTVVKQLAMRRTVFAFPRALLPSVWGSASARVADQLAIRLAKEVAANGLTDDGPRWVARVTVEVQETLERDGPATTAELRERLPDLSLRLELSPGKAYGGSFPVASRVLSTLAAAGTIVRGANDGDWRLSRPRWQTTEGWLGEPTTRASAEEGYRALVEAWLRRFGPGTEADIVWWLGATKSAVRRALADLGAVEVRLDPGPGGDRGYVLPDDLDDVPPPEPWAALLPVLDPTTMGWKGRSFYLGVDDAPHLFDTNGNAGTTAWWDGRIVGCWVQDPDGVVTVVHLHDDLGAEARAALSTEAERLTGWLEGDRVSTVYASALMRSAR
jgi:hypothetical protein